MSGRKLGESEPMAVAATDIPSGSKSSPFNLSTISRKLSLEKISFPLEVTLNQRQEMCPVKVHGIGSGTTSDASSGSGSTYFWPKLIQFAPDCHLQNVKICRWEQDTLILQATRFIRSGQPLYLWFEENILVDDLGIPPYLSPANIRGGKSYVCHKCGNEFETPNPLKIHLALECERFGVNILWNRLSTLKSFPPAAAAFSLLVASAASASLIRPSCFVPTQLQMLRRIEMPMPMQMPMSISIPSSPRPRSLPSTTIAPTSTMTTTGGSMSTNANSNSHLSLASKTHSEHQAHLEAIMSNMGKSKNGHVCLYCGKLYSRKYGLKIHIRTHTGFKPLHCRICKRPFGDPSNLNKHVRLHSDGNTPYRCDICSKVLVRKRDLDRHVRSRHPNTFVSPGRINQISSTVSSTTSTNIPASV